MLVSLSPSKTLQGHESRQRAGHSSIRNRALGQSVVEFGLIAMLFFGLLFGIFDLGMMFSGWISLGAASSVAARQAAVGALADVVDRNGNVSPGVVSSVQANAMVPGVAPTALKVVVTDCGAGGTCSTFCPTAAPAGVTCVAGLPAPNIGDQLTVAVYADTYQLVTPPMRLAFGCTPQSTGCPPLTSSTTVRYEGAYVNS